MIPVLFAPKTREYNNNGLGVLVDVGFCTVTEERNGAFELELQYPVNGSHYSDLAVDCQILAKPNETSDPQAFRVYNISKPMNGVVTVRAEHISYELSSVVVSPFSASNVGEALSKIKSNSVTENVFTFWTDKNTVANMSQSTPKSARSLLGGVEGSVLDVYTGEYEFDNYTVKLHQNRGRDNGVTIAYAKNLTGVKCEERSDGIVTGVIAYWTGETDGIAQAVYGDLQTIETSLSYSRNVIVDCSSEFTDPPSKASLNEYALKYIQTHKNVPYFSVSVEFVNLGDTEEYKQYKGLYRVCLCDTVTVKHPLYGIDVKAKVVKTVFDSVREKYEKIEIGEASANISQTIAAQEKEIAQKVGFSELDKAVANATSSIAGNKGGYVVLYPSAINPQELLILDKPTIEEAVNVWRWNLAGLGHSKTGYNGDFTTAITADGQIVADFITTGTLNASIIKAGVLSSKNGLATFSLETGEIVVGGENYNTTISHGSIEQHLTTSRTANNLIGGLVPTGYSNGLYETLYYDAGTANGVFISKKETNGTFNSIADFRFNSPVCLTLKSGIITGNEQSGTTAALTHYRKAVYSSVSAESYVEAVSFGCAGMDGFPSLFLQVGEGGWDNAEARFDFYRNEYSEVVLRASSKGIITPRLIFSQHGLEFQGGFTIGNDNEWSNIKGQNICIGAADLGASGFRTYIHENVLVGGNLHANGVVTNSDRKIKKNIKPASFKNAENAVKNLKIYDYDLKETGNSVKMGLMADEAPGEIVSENGKGINLYSYCGLLAMAIQEMSEKIERLEKGGKDYVGSAE